MPEFQHNVKFIFDMVDLDIHTFDQNLRYKRKFMEIYQKEKEQLQKEIAWKKQQLHNIEDIMGALDRIQESVTVNKIA